MTAHDYIIEAYMRKYWSKKYDTIKETTIR